MTTPPTTPTKFCRLCGSTDYVGVLDLGVSPLANDFVTDLRAAEQAVRYPLRLVCCTSCSALQLGDRVSLHNIFRQYPYRSSISRGVLRRARSLAARIVRERSLDRTSLVLEIGSNDGYRLQYYRALGIRVLGVDPAVNLVAAAATHGIDTLPMFFTAALARELHSAGVEADVVHLHNVLAHIEDVHDALDGIRLLVRRDGLVVIEVPYAADMVQGKQFDLVYHEHVYYFSLEVLRRVSHAHGLVPVRVERTPNQGGSIEVWLAPIRSSVSQERSVIDLLDFEARAGLQSIAYYERMQADAESVASALSAWAHEALRSGALIGGYGASAKGTTLLNFCHLRAGQIFAIADSTPEKQGKFMPGVAIPILSPAAVMHENPKFVLVLARNVVDEVCSTESVFLDSGGEFVIAIPTLKRFGRTGRRQPL